MRALMCILKDDSAFAVRFRLAPGPLFPNQRAWLPLAWIPACSRSLSAGHVNTCSLGPRCWAGRVWKHGFASFRTPSVSALGHPLCARPWGQSPEIVIVLTAKLRTCEPMSPLGEGHELLGPRGHVMAPERLGGQGGVGAGRGSGVPDLRMLLPSTSRGVRVASSCAVTSQVSGGQDSPEVVPRKQGHCPPGLPGPCKPASLSTCSGPGPCQV